MISLRVNDWEFRLLNDGQVESRCVGCGAGSDKSQWKIRGALEVNLLDDQLYHVGEAIRNVRAAVPNDVQHFGQGAKSTDNPTVRPEPSKVV